MRDCSRGLPKWIISENKTTMLRFDACVEKGRVVFVEVVWVFFSSLSMNQQRLYHRRLIIAKRLNRIFLLYSSPLFDRLISRNRVQCCCNILIHTHHRPTVITSTFSRPPTVSHRRCTTTSASKTSWQVSGGGPPDACMLQWTARLRIPLAADYVQRSILFFCLFVVFGAGTLITLLKSLGKRTYTHVIPIYNNNIVICIAM